MMHFQLDNSPVLTFTIKSKENLDAKSFLGVTIAQSFPVGESH